MSYVCCETCVFFKGYDQECFKVNWYACVGAEEYEDDNGDIISECDNCSNSCNEYVNKYAERKRFYGLINLE
jgi:hypothetical protein